MVKEKFSLKDHLFNERKVTYLGQLFASTTPKFNTKQFTKDVMERLLELELKERIVWIAVVLEKHLPSDFKKSSVCIVDALPPALDETQTDGDFGDFILAPLGEYVVRNGAKQEYLSESFATLLALTQRFSMEDAMRTFINEFQKETLTQYKLWSKHKNYHVRRLVSESLRPSLPWSKKITLPYTDAVSFLSLLHRDNTRYVTRSVANHLNDISKKDPKLVVNLLAKWKQEGGQETHELAWMTRHALRTLIKAGNPDALTLLGFTKNIAVTVTQFSVPTQKIVLPGLLSFSFELHGVSSGNLLIDYSIDFVKANGKTKPKVFKIKKCVIKSGEVIHVTKNHRLRGDATTFTLRPGVHSLTLLINGSKYNTAEFVITTT